MPSTDDPSAASTSNSGPFAVPTGARSPHVPPARARGGLGQTPNLTPPRSAAFRDRIVNQPRRRKVFDRNPHRLEHARSDVSWPWPWPRGGSCRTEAAATFRNNSVQVCGDCGRRPCGGAVGLRCGRERRLSEAVCELRVDPARLAPAPAGRAAERVLVGTAKGPLLRRSRRTDRPSTAYPNNC